MCLNGQRGSTSDVAVQIAGYRCRVVTYARIHDRLSSGPVRLISSGASNATECTAVLYFMREEVYGERVRC